MSKKIELEGKLSQLGSQLSMWENMVESSGWKAFQLTLDQQRTMRMLTVGGQPLKSFGEVMPQEFMKGEAAGIGLALTYPLTQIELLKLDIAHITTAIEMEPDNVQENRETDESGGSRVDSGAWFGSDGLS